MPQKIWPLPRLPDLFSQLCILWTPQHYVLKAKFVVTSIACKPGQPLVSHILVTSTTTCSVIQIKYFGVVCNTSFSYPPITAPGYTVNLTSVVNPNPKTHLFLSVSRITTSIQAIKSSCVIYHSSLVVCSFLLLL